MIYENDRWAHIPLETCDIGAAKASMRVFRRQ